MTDKILILLSYWKGDRAQAMTLARLLADLQSVHSGACDFAFVARRDCKHDTASINHVSRKFTVFTAISQRPETGWPQGCNGLFFGSIDWCLRGISGGKLPKYKAILNLASDTAPLVNDGLLYLHSEWDRLCKHGVKVAGAMVGGNARCQGGSHINADCMLISGELDFLTFLAKQAGSVIRGGGGHDWVLAPQYELKGWANIPGIQSHWKRPTFQPAEWDILRAAGVRWVHGTKDNSLLEIARKRLL